MSVGRLLEIQTSVRFFQRVRPALHWSNVTFVQASGKLRFSMSRSLSSLLAVPCGCSIENPKLGLRSFWFLTAPGDRLEPRHATTRPLWHVWRGETHPA